MHSTAWQLNIFTLPGLQWEITPTKLSGSAKQDHFVAPVCFKEHPSSHKSPNKEVTEFYCPRPSPDPGWAFPQALSPANSCSPRRSSQDNAPKTAQGKLLSGSWHGARTLLKEQNDPLPTTAGFHWSFMTHGHSANHKLCLTVDRISVLQCNHKLF